MESKPLVERIAAKETPDFMKLAIKNINGFMQNVIIEKTDVNKFLSEKFFRIKVNDGIMYSLHQKPAHAPHVTKSTRPPDIEIRGQVIDTETYFPVDCVYNIQVLDKDHDEYQEILNLFDRLMAPDSEIIVPEDKKIILPGA
jgi:hypothetical protein